MPLRDGRMLAIRSFEPQYAEVVADWLANPQDARWAAPQTDYPICAANVLAWADKSDHPFLGFVAGELLPVVYGEVNSFQEATGNESWLGHLAVAPARRGLGLGGAFCQSLLHFAVHVLHRDAVSLVVFPDNASAIACYQRAGFKITGTERKTFPSFPGEYELVRMTWTRA